MAYLYKDNYFDMDEFDKQLDRNLHKDLQIFNTSMHLVQMRNLYKQNFDVIKTFIQRTNPRSAIEDILNLDKMLPGLKGDDFFLLQQINRGIVLDKISVSDIL